MIKSGADELLDLERAEDDEDDEGDLADSTYHRRHDSSIREKVEALAMVNFTPSTARQWASTPESSHASKSLLSCPEMRLLLL